jgi:SPX domain protein involved in polyphosphate accumulation
VALSIRQFVLCHLEPDTFTAGREGMGYPVHSLYFDSPDLLTCQATMQGEKNRFKLRVRFYDDHADNPLFLEIKRRQDKVILKQRAAVKRSCTERLVGGGRLERADLFFDDERNFQAMFNFCELVQKIQARPAAYTSYMREGYELPHDNRTRVTFDRELRAGPFAASIDISELEHWSKPDLDGVVLELKFTDRPPSWMHELAEAFDLQRTSVPKYVECISLLHRE